MTAINSKKNKNEPEYTVFTEADNINVTSFDTESAMDKDLKITPDAFKEFIFSKKSHFKLFQGNKYDKLFYGQEIGETGFNIKTYQNLLLFSFITQNIPESSRILEIGNKDDYIINHFKQRYEIWRIEDANSLMNRNNAAEIVHKNALKDNLGNYHDYLPLRHFDFIFSASGFDNFPDDMTLFKIVLDNINRMLKANSYSLHCFSAAITGNNVQYHRLLNFFNNHSFSLYYPVISLSKLPRKEAVLDNEDLHFNFEIHEKSYIQNTDFGTKTVSYNFLWKKNPLELSKTSDSKVINYIKKHPAYVFHHLMKCGGTSLTKALQNWFNLKLDHIKTEDITIDLNQYLNYKFNIENINSEDCIVSHFQSEGYYLHERYPEVLSSDNNFRIFTFIRDPLSIVTSLYYYARKSGGFHNISLINSIEYSKKNFLASLFPCDESNYKEVLDRYFFIGIVEKMQESMDKLALLLEKKKINIPMVNTTEKDSQISELTPEFIKIFKEKNKLDYKIYNYCLEKLNHF